MKLLIELKYLIIQLNKYTFKYRIWRKNICCTTKNCYDSLESSWRSEFYRSTKDLEEDETRFWEAVIKGYKNVLTEEFNFYLKLGHSENWKY